MACGILVPQPGIEPSSPAVEAQSLNHWCAREVPISFSFFLDFAYKRCHISASVLNPWFLWSPKGIGKFFLLSGWNILEHFKRGFVGSEFITRMGMWGSLAPSWLEEALPVLASGKGGLGLEGGRVEVQRSLCLRPSRVCLLRQAHPHLPCCLSLEGGGWKSGRSPCRGPSRVCLPRQAHPHLPCRLPGLRVLRLLRCCVRDPWARPRHQVLAQRAVGLHRRPLRVPSVRQQEILSEDHVMARRWLASLPPNLHLPAKTARVGVSQSWQWGLSF